MALGVLAVMATVQFVLNTGTITYSRNLQPNPVYGRIDELFAANAAMMRSASWRTTSTNWSSNPNRVITPRRSSSR